MILLISKEEILGSTLINDGNVIWLDNLRMPQTSLSWIVCRPSLIERSTVLNALNSAVKNIETRKQLGEWIIALDPNISKCAIHVAAWSHALSLTGRYTTKARRDCSQTPFVVPCAASENKMKRRDITSVEEEICPVVVTVACGEISKEIPKSQKMAMDRTLYLAWQSFTHQEGKTWMFGWSYQ